MADDAVIQTSLVERDASGMKDVDRGIGSGQSRAEKAKYVTGMGKMGILKGGWKSNSTKRNL